MQTIVIRQCVRKACSFRFPAEESNPSGGICPKCGSTTIVEACYPKNPSARSENKSTIMHVEGFLDNLRSVYNVGSIFRSADGCGVKKLHLGGITPPPTHSGMAKTALGADQHIPWSQHWDGLKGVLDLKQANYTIIGLEYTTSSIPIFDYHVTGEPLLLIVGNENHGIDPEILNSCDHIVHIPMAGFKESLNGSIAFSIAAYWLIYGKNEK